MRTSGEMRMQWRATARRIWTSIGQHPPASWPGVVKVLVALAISAAVVVHRRPDQFINPGVWNEELIFILPEWVGHGWASIFADINGTFPVPTRLLLGVSLELFPSTWPAVNALAATLVTATTIGLIMWAPTVLRWSFVVALLVLLMPTDAETFGVGLYTFWWFQLWSLLAVLWRPKATGQVLRVLLAWVGALANPVGATFALLGWLRYIGTRAREDLRFSLWVTLPAVMTIVGVFTSGRQIADDPTDFANVLPLVKEVIARFFGFWVWSPQGFSGPSAEHLVLGALLLGVLLAGLLIEWRTWSSWVLASALAVSVGSVLIRVTPTILHPITAGPRYFFFTFVIIASILTRVIAIRVGRLPGRIARWSAAGLLLIALVNIGGLVLFNGLNRGDLPMHIGFRRYHTPYSWGDQLEWCAIGAPIQGFHDGSPSGMLSVAIPPEWCAGVS